MASKKSPVEEVIERFPEQGMLIENLYTSSDSFRCLCQDFADCLNVIKRLDKSSEMIRCGYKKEYETLLQELEEELVRILSPETDEKKS
jgi:hypothetical protein